ncbi:HAMP domain-containing sensor histidine kinase [Pedobacter sp. PLR]|uniref:sensor histidine kinase n=1 Tax=Pedobacter sp. PLR TaxID=2994465 RepID=UPI0022484828|nr:HAMP domain-containing sensor histidine kinase [Pedobacter sp. PLR]MCX2450141.1 HAMP domain-containing sensor histidine kinase [Pedobacter sp. PLR]
MPKSNFSILNDYFSKKNAFWVKLIGSPSMFSLESRIFHSICIGLIALACLYVPYDIYANLYVAALSTFIIGLFFLHQYYYSRFHGKAHNSTLFGLIGVLILGINYFSNSGINGSTDLIWPAYLLLVFAISPYQQHIKWLIVYLSCFLVLHVLEYYYPFLVKYPFTAGRGQFIDRITAFPIPVITIYIVIKFMRRSYDKERKATEEKTIAVQTLMSIISHDMKTPLMNIQSYLELLNTSVVDPEDRLVLEKALLKSTNNTMEMLSNLLHWSKSQMEGPSVNLVVVNLMTTIQGTMEMESMHALKKDIYLSYHIPPTLEVIADVNMLQLVVRNLISNAVKFTSHGGQITMKAEVISNECKISVSDNGKGIPLDKQGNIFSIKSEPEFGTDNERGIGLGLVLCKEFIERQGGRIGFESNPGLGSHFFIFIKLKPKTLLSDHVTA